MTSKINGIFLYVQYIFGKIFMKIRLGVVVLSCVGDADYVVTNTKVGARFSRLETNAIELKLLTQCAE